MLTEKDTIKCESIFNDDHTHRFLWRRMWDKDKPLACVIMLNPCISNNILLDLTSCLVLNNVARLEEYGGVIVVNLYSKLTSKLCTKWFAPEELNDPVNDSYIRRAAEDSDIVIAAWGKSGENNQQIAERVEEVLGVLGGLENKIHYIADCGGRVGIHPLTPSIRDEWFLVPLREYIKMTSDSAETQDHSKKEEQTEKSL